MSAFETFTFTDALWMMVDQVVNTPLGFAPNVMAVHTTAYIILQARVDAGTSDDFFLTEAEVASLYDAAYLPWWDVNPGDFALPADGAEATYDTPATPAADPTPAAMPAAPTKGRGKGKAIADHHEPSPSKVAVVGKKRPFVPRTQKFTRCANACGACKKRRGKCEAVPNAHGCLRCVELGLVCERRAPGERMYGTQGSCIEKMKLLGLDYFRSRDKKPAAAAAAARASSASDSPASSEASPGGTSWAEEDEEEEEEEAESQPAFDHSHPLETPSAIQDVEFAGYVPPTFEVTPVDMQNWQQDAANEEFLAGFLSGFAGQEWLQPATSEPSYEKLSAGFDMACIDPALLKM